ncbi:MAG: hypothetical protein QOD92_4398 [Acidimicrobiaceae bacterium]|jgi:hypothetical protein
MTAAPQVFRLDEYGTAGKEFFGDAVHALARASSPLLDMIRVEHVDALPPTRNTLSTGEEVPGGSMETKSMVTLSISEGIDGTFDDVHEAINKMSEDYASSVVPQMLEHISRLTEATGNVVDAQGRTVWEAQLEMLETISLSFDEDGNPSLPSIVMNPNDELGDPPAGFEEKFNDVIARRRDEWLAGRRSRRLPRQRDGA